MDRHQIAEMAFSRTAEPEHSGGWQDQYAAALAASTTWNSADENLIVPLRLNRAFCVS